ncbi:MAG TPA: D-glycerate dehydrogenase [Bryobacteraceae bacterium]|nr:D-glycerate dehydrogenase [Bryobacteraceae bacterium]
MQPSVLVTRRIYPEAIEFLKQHAEVDYNPTDDILSPADLLARAKGKQAIVSQLVDKFTRDVLAQVDVQIIANVAVGFDNIDVPAATERGILVTNTPDVLTDTTADFAFALLMAAARRVVEAHQFLHSGKWNRWTIDMLVGQDVHHRTLGILGMGRIGQAMARRGSGFSMRILYHDAAPVPVDAEFVSKEQALRDSDFISLHVPLTETTRHYIGEAELRMMKTTAILINTSRGPVVDEAALARALREKWIGGAGIDVFEREPQVLPDLLKCETAVLAPHIASASVDTRRGMSMIAVENVVDALEGRRPKTLLNPLAWDSSARHGTPSSR